MLALSRRVGEELVIVVDNEQIRVKVLEIRGNHVKFGVAAPKHKEIRRENKLDTEFRRRWGSDGDR